MCELLAFRKESTRFRRERELHASDAEIIFFPGVRYMRMAEPVQAAKPGRAPKRRATPKAEKAS